MTHPSKPSNARSGLPKEVIFLISSFVFPLKNQQTLGFQFKLARSFLQSAITDYLPKPLNITSWIGSLFTPPLYLEHARSFQNIISKSNQANFTKLCSSQLALFKVKESALCNAVAEGSSEKVKILLEQKINPNIFSKGKGTTPLCMAVAQEDVEIVALLTKHGADPFQKNSEGRTPISLAAEIEDMGISRKITNILTAQKIEIKPDPFYQSITRTCNRINF